MYNRHKIKFCNPYIASGLKPLYFTLSDYLVDQSLKIETHIFSTITPLITELLTRT